jgi:lipoate-protein ligase A
VRPTGGRAIFHDEEWTFSLCLPAGADGRGPDPREAYSRSCRLLADAFTALGVPARLSPGSPRGVGPPRAREGPAAPCFTSSARDELTLEGRKLAGIAQRSVRGALLQQGSLLLGPAHLRLADYLRVDEAGRAALRAGLAAAAAEAGASLGGDVRLERLAGALAARLPEASRLEGEDGWHALAT